VEQEVVADRIIPSVGADFARGLRAMATLGDGERRILADDRIAAES
jgi:hypothetical protein